VSQSVIPSIKHLGGAKPFVFTEQGVSMLSSILTSKVAIEINIRIMRTFVNMRKLILTNSFLQQRINYIETKQLKDKLESDKKFDQIFEAIEFKASQPEQGIFFNGQVFDAYQFISNLIRNADRSIMILDNYIDDTVLTHLSKRKKGVKITIATKHISKKLKLDVKKFNSQYPKIKLIEFKDSHDRFIIIDEQIVYHFGASLKDLGKKWFAFSRMDIDAIVMLSRLEGEIN